MLFVLLKYTLVLNGLICDVVVIVLQEGVTTVGASNADVPRDIGK